MEMKPYIVYAKPNDSDYIVSVNSSAFLVDATGWVEIDSGYDTKHHHAQGNYFPQPIRTMGGAWRYKLVDGAVEECTAEEVAEQEEANKPSETYSAQDDTDAMLVDHEYRLTLLELGITE